MTMKARNYVLIGMIAGAVFFFCIATSIWALKSWPVDPAYVVLGLDETGQPKPGTHWARQVGDDGLEIGRLFRITREVSLRIYREIQLREETNEIAAMTPNGPEMFKFLHQFELEKTDSPYHPGYYKNKRELKLPASIAPGIYVIANHVCWDVNFMREDCKDLPDVTVEIKR